MGLLAASRAERAPYAIACTIPPVQPRFLGFSAPSFRSQNFHRLLAAAAIVFTASLAGAQPAGLALSESFAAVADEGGGIPPDPQGAAGPEHLLAMTNTRFTAQSKDGSLATTWTPAQFWAPVSQGDFLFDPRVMYDSLSGRWIAVMATTGSNAAPAILLAVSSGPDPTQAWQFQRIPVDASGGKYAEFPLLGGNVKWICITANLLSLSTGEGGGVAVWAIEKVPLLSNNTLSVSRFTLPDASSPVAPVVTFDADQPDEFLVQQWSENNGGHGQLELSRVTDTGGHASLRTVETVSAPATWIDHPNPFDSLPQSDTTRLITASQDDVASACLRHEMIWAVQTATIPAGAAPLHSVIQWWRITAAGALSGFGRIGDATGVTWLGYPSIAVNSREQVVIGYSIFSPERFASAGFSLRPGGCDSALSEIHTLRDGDAAYERLDGAGLNRWGDLSETVVDPSDDLRIWTIQEYAAPHSGGTSRWGTWWGGFAPAAAGRESACIAPVPKHPPVPVERRGALPSQ
jgi:hypothetical protein